MNKKLFTIFLVAIFLLACIGFASAEDTSGEENSTVQKISVKIKWNDDGQTSQRPDSITVNLIKDGKIVDKETLSPSNSWSATFEVEDEGSYSVNESELSNYSVSIKGSASEGFVITNTFNSDVLGASQDNTSENTTLGVAENETLTGAENETASGTDDGNNASEDTPKNTTATGEEDKNTTTVTKKQDSSKNVKQEPKKEDKKPNVTKNDLRNTGIPIIVLVLIVIVIAVVLFTRKNN